MGQVGMIQEELTAIFYRGGSPLPCGSEKKEKPSLQSCRLMERHNPVESGQRCLLPPWSIPPIAAQKLQLVVMFSLSQFHHRTASLNTFSHIVLYLAASGLLETFTCPVSSHSGPRLPSHPGDSLKLDFCLLLFLSLMYSTEERVCDVPIGSGHSFVSDPQWGLLPGGIEEQRTE